MALPVVTGHPADQRAFAVHHFVVAQRQHEPLAPGVHQSEGQFIVMVAAMDRVTSHVAQCVVHPTQVPLEVEPEPALGHRPGDPGERGRLLGDEQRMRVFDGDDRVELTQEGDGLQILAAAMRVRRPFPRLAAVVAVEHRGHRIDPQSVEAERTEPMQRAADQEIPHLTTTEVVDQRVPIRVVALARILVLVERAAIETGEPMRVSREMRRHPIEQHTKPHRMGSRHEATQRRRIAMTRGRRIKTDGLIAPRAVERMLGHRQEFEVREPEIGDIGQQRIGQFVPGQERLRGVIVPAP